MWLIRMSPTDDVSAQINMDMGLRSQISMDIQIISEFFPSVKYKIKILQYSIYIYNLFSSLGQMSENGGIKKYQVA